MQCMCCMPTAGTQTHTDTPAAQEQPLYCRRNAAIPLPVLPHSQLLTLDVADCADDVIVQQVLQDLVLLGLMTNTPQHTTTHTTQYIVQNTQKQPTKSANDSKQRHDPAVKASVRGQSPQLQHQSKAWCQQVLVSMHSRPRQQWETISRLAQTAA